jgi:hypothetical protein
MIPPQNRYNPHYRRNDQMLSRKLFMALLCLLPLSFAGCGGVYRIQIRHCPMKPRTDSWFQFDGVIA